MIHPPDSSVPCSVFAELGNHQHSHLRTFHHPPKESCTPRPSPPHAAPPLPSPRQPRIHFPSPRIGLFCTFRINGIAGDVVSLCPAYPTRRDVLRAHPRRSERPSHSRAGAPAPADGAGPPPPWAALNHAARSTPAQVFLRTWMAGSFLLGGLPERKCWVRWSLCFAFGGTARSPRRQPHTTFPPPISPHPLHPVPSEFPKT